MECKYSTAALLLQDLEKEGFNISAPIDIDAIASMLGIDVVYDNSLVGKDIVGKIEFNDNKPVISVNPAENNYEPRRRFTLAHEIGHYCLHSSPPKSFLDTKKCMNRNESYWDKYESESNSFAAQLLMPKTLIIKRGKEIASELLKDSKDSKIPRSEFVAQMSNAFKISNPSMEYRLKNIGILS